ncbi:Integrase, catalytic core protein [Phytophthora megakarya]|uniref:Integrase, catalytic core protein n=1 Tax=Phytophthora megakarya TaxID=4795 RepID=A0A225V1Q5_9STRA|nr:Integrase, catalytic core protein [Phytophthora megakarya]
MQGMLKEKALYVQLQMKVTRKKKPRIHRDETPSEEERVERGAAKPDVKKTLQGTPQTRYLDDYVTNLTLNNSRVLDQSGRPIQACEIKVPRNRREMLWSKWREFFLMAEIEEMAALKAEGVIKEIPGGEVPEDAHPGSTMWVYAVKSDYQGYVVRFKARIVALGNYQCPGIDFLETFAPVARMSSFRMLMAIAAELELDVYGVPGYIYIVLKALYGLHQSGREWNSEFNQWFINHGYQRSLTEPCLYYRLDGDAIMYVLVYVDDILVATNNEQCKSQVFKELNEAYGLKDQGLLSQYLGVEVKQMKESITLSQGQYAREILEKFGYERVHTVGNPMEVNMRLGPLNEKETSVVKSIKNFT